MISFGLLAELLLRKLALLGLFGAKTGSFLTISLCPLDAGLGSVLCARYLVEADLDIGQVIVVGSSAGLSSGWCSIWFLVKLIDLLNELKELALGLRSLLILSIVICREASCGAERSHLGSHWVVLGEHGSDWELLLSGEPHS